jgi:hypothetical protein
MLLDMDLDHLIMDLVMDLVPVQDLMDLDLMVLCLAVHPEEVVVIKSIILRPEIKNKK